MDLSKKRILVTSALPYANGPLHVGHVAGAYLNADIFVRYLRAIGKDVVWVCGSDEHGAAITLRAKKEGVHPREIVDKYHGILENSFKQLNISFDHYDRTSSEKHHQTAQDFFKVLNEKGSFEVKTSEQFYDEQEKQFLADRYITGTCPHCGNENAYGDQCEKCGKDLSPTDLINPKSVLSGATPILKETSLWYLPMDQHEEWLKDYIENGSLNGENHHDVKEWKKHVLGQCKSWLNDGLKSRAMTRDLDWGVPVPVEGAEGKVLYVWLDAPIGYITSTKVWAEKNGKDWRDYWQSEDAELIHFIGKDNIVFHCIIFPIILKEHGNFVLPHNVPANEFMNLQGEKISTSRNWAVWIHEYVEQYPDQIDELRYVLTSIMPELKDSEFTWEEFQNRINNELADNLGNFVNRGVVLTNKYFEGKIPEFGELTSEDQEVMSKASEFPQKIGDLIASYRFKEALTESMNLARLGNTYLASEEPWKVYKTDPKRVETIMRIVLEIAAKCSFVLEPFMPSKSKTIQRGLGLNDIAWNDLKNNLLETGSKVEKLPILFKKIEDELVQSEIEKLENTKTESNNHPPMKDVINFEDFSKLDIRIGTIMEAEKIEKTDKLLKLKVDTGLDTRTVVSGIAQSYSPEDIIGKKVSVLLNLEPRKIRGVESQGMILMAENEEGQLSLVSPEKESINSGDSVR